MSKKKSPAECEAFKQELAIQIEGISKLADTWNVGYAKTKSDLYGVLSDCFEIIKTKFIDASKAEKKLFRQQVIEELTKKNVRVQDNSTVAGLFFRLVFKAGRNRAHSYATVINVADDEGISPADLPAFIFACLSVMKNNKLMMIHEWMHSFSRLSFSSDDYCFVGLWLFQIGSTN